MTRKGERSVLRRRDAEHVVDVKQEPVHDGPTVELTHVQDILRLAKRYEAFVMRLEQPFGEVFLLWDQGLMYRCVARVRAEEPASADDSAARPGPAMAPEMPEEASLDEEPAPPGRWLATPAVAGASEDRAGGAQPGAQANGAGERGVAAPPRAPAPPVPDAHDSSSTPGAAAAALPAVGASPSALQDSDDQQALLGTGPQLPSPDVPAAPGPVPAANSPQPSQDGPTYDWRGVPAHLSRDGQPASAPPAAAVPGDGPALDGAVPDAFEPESREQH